LSTNTILATTPLVSTNYLLRATGTTIGNSLIWDNGTNVGIGNTNTSYTLDVTGTGRFSGALNIGGNQTFTGAVGTTKYIITDETASGTGRLVIQAGGGSASFGGAINLYAASNPTYTGDVAIGLSATTGAKFRVNSSALDGGTDLLTILRTGNVGIGGVSANYLLDVNKSVAGDFIARFLNSSSTGYGLYVQTNDNTKPAIRIANASGGTAIDLSGSGVVTSTNSTSGAQAISAINNSAANSRCYYGQKYSGSTDDYYMIFDNAVANKFLFYGNGGLGNVQANNGNISDVRTKKDIIPLESYWDKFKAIEIVKFKYIDQDHDDYNIGVIAQQLEEVAPEFIDADGWGKGTPSETEEPLKSVYTTDLYHATIKVLQEAMTKIEELSKQNEELSNRLIKLESK
jgi:hypothetical protein